MTAVDERVADGAQRMTLPDARQPEREDIRGVLEDVALGEFVEATHQSRWQAPFIERGKRFSRWEFGRPAQSGRAALLSRVGFIEGYKSSR